MAKKIEKIETTAKSVDSVGLAYAAIHLAMGDISKTRDQDIIDLIRKSRKLLNVMFDAVIGDNE